MIGIAGCGVVGDAMMKALRHKGYTDDFVMYDPPRGLSATFMDFHQCEMVLICVPSPMNLDGSQDLTIIESVVKGLVDTGYTGVACIKSTITPKNVIYLTGWYRKRLRIITNPEFLTQRRAVQDCIESPFIIIGGSLEDTRPLRDLYSRFWRGSKVYLTTPAAAMMSKYLVNAALSVKVSFMNECKKLWDQIGDTPWKDLADAVSLDPRLGHTHLDVPGPDGDHGWGGKCFPKDLLALTDMAETMGVVHNVMTAAWATNLEVRTSRDWETIPGAVTKETVDGEQAKDLDHSGG